MAALDDAVRRLESGAWRARGRRPGGGSTSNAAAATSRPSSRSCRTTAPGSPSSSMAPARGARFEAATDDVGRRVQAAIGAVETVLVAPMPAGRNEPERRMPQVNVTIAGRSYRMACGEGEEAHLEGLAAAFEAKIAEMRGTFGEIGDMRLHVMAAITLADELPRGQEADRALEAEVAHSTASTPPGTSASRAIADRGRRWREANTRPASSLNAARRSLIPERSGEGARTQALESLLRSNPGCHRMIVPPKRPALAQLSPSATSRIPTLTGGAAGRVRSSYSPGPYRS